MWLTEFTFSIQISGTIVDKSGRTLSVARLGGICHPACLMQTRSGEIDLSFLPPFLSGFISSDDDSLGPGRELLLPIPTVSFV